MRSEFEKTLKQHRDSLAEELLQLGKYREAQLVEWDIERNESDYEFYFNSGWNAQQSKVDELQKRVDELEKTQSRFELKAEEAECVSMCLDDHSVAKCDQDGKSYSLWGRVCQFKKTGNFTEDDLERIYWEFDSERAKQGEERLRFKEALRILLEQALKGES